MMNCCSRLQTFAASHRERAKICNRRGDFRTDCIAPYDVNYLLSVAANGRPQSTGRHKHGAPDCVSAAIEPVISAGHAKPIEVNLQIGFTRRQRSNGASRDKKKPPDRHRGAASTDSK